MPAEAGIDDTPGLIRGLHKLAWMAASAAMTTRLRTSASTAQARTTPLSASSCSIGVMSARMRSLGAP